MSTRYSLNLCELDYLDGALYLLHTIIPSPQGTAGPFSNCCFLTSG